MNSEKSLNVLILVSNKVILEGLKKVLLENRTPTRVFTGEDNSGQVSPDIVLFDINQSIQLLRSLYPGAKPILLDTGIDDREVNYLLLCHQVRGIIAPKDSVDMFYKALNVVQNGEIWIDQDHLKSLLVNAGAMTVAGDIKELSAQDKKIIKMICQGSRNKEIADSLCLSEYTIKSHVSRIYKKLNVKNRAQLVSLAQENRFAELKEPE